MSEAAPQQPDKIPRTYVTDVEKAEAMAYATKLNEENALAANNHALEAVRGLDSGRVVSMRALNKMSKHFDKAEKYRKSADNQAGQISDSWDKLNEANHSSIGELGGKGYTQVLASLTQEQAASEAVVLGKEALLNLDDRKWRTYDPESDIPIRLVEKARKIGKVVMSRSAKAEVKHQLSAAQRARAGADRRARYAGEVYDRLNEPLLDEDYSEEPEKAELVEKVTRKHRRVASNSSNAGIEAAIATGDYKWNSVRGLNTRRKVRHQLGSYDRSRKSARRKAGIASHAFDRHKRFKNRQATA